MSTTKKTKTVDAPVAAPVLTADPRIAAMATQASDLANAIAANPQRTRALYADATKASDEGPFELLTQAASTIRNGEPLRPDDFAVWVRPDRNSDELKIANDAEFAVERIIRSAHGQVEYETSTEAQGELRRYLHLAAHASGVAVCREVKEKLGRKNFKVADEAMKESSLEKLAIANAIPDPSGRNEPTIAQRCFAAIGDPQALAVLDRRLNTLQVRGATFRASLFLPYIADDIRALCDQHGMKPATVWQKSVTTAAKVHKEQVAAKASGDTIVAAVKSAVREELLSAGKATTSVKEVASDLEKYVRAQKALFDAFRALIASPLAKVTKEEAKQFRNWMAGFGVRDTVADAADIAAEEAKAKAKAKELADAAALKAQAKLVPALPIVPTLGAAPIQQPETGAAVAAADGAAKKGRRKAGQSFAAPTVDVPAVSVVGPDVAAALDATI